MDSFNAIASIAFGMIAAWVVFEKSETYIPLQTDPGDDPSKYYASPMEVMNETLYVTNPESLYAGFSLEPGKQVQKIPIGPPWWTDLEMSRRFQVFHLGTSCIPSRKMQTWRLNRFQSLVQDLVELKCFPIFKR
jgi:hypothetical protein